MKCTKCNIEKELVKGKRWCKNCKNEYERERRKKNPESIVENNKKERERYYTPFYISNADFYIVQTI